MKRPVILLVLIFMAMCQTMAQGVPFIRNFQSEEYHAHSQNFDIITGSDGTIYVANFEGLLYYDNSQWRIIHTPGVTRITAVFRDSKDVVWTGGYNYFGFVEKDPKGSLKLHTLDTKALRGEVNWIWEKNKQIYFLASNDKIYTLKGKQIVHQPNEQLPTSGFTTLSTKVHVNQIQQLEDGLQAIATNGDGLVITDQKGNKLLSITEENGLCSNNIAHITYNRLGQIWGATDNGIFAISLPSCYTRFTTHEGIKTEVLALDKFGDAMYVGTLNGLYKKEGMKFIPVPQISYTCWQIVTKENKMLLATMDGTYQMDAHQNVRQLTTASTLSIMFDGDNFYSGEMDGVYYNTSDGKRQKINNVEKVIKILRDRSNCIWLQTIYGNIWKSNKQNTKFEAFTSETVLDEVATLVVDNGNVRPILANAKKPFPYPMFSYTDKDNTIWLTNNKGRMLYAYKNKTVDEKITKILKPFSDYSFRALYRDGDKIWIGGKDGICIIDPTQKPILMNKEPHVIIRSITTGQDSILWGGYGELKRLPKLPSNDRHLLVTYGLNFPEIIGKPTFRHRINGGKWSAWDTDFHAELYNQPYGDNLFEVQARDIWGRTSDITSFNFSFEYPLYLRWYMLLLYIAIIMQLGYLIQKFRVRRLEEEKVKLENLVKERTSEVVRLEKMATAGKLTQGLIDRILNPLNYINNFAKLSEGLVRDVEANVEDEKDNMDEENYEDTMDVLEMLKGNLQKVGEHGANTSRTLKAMEEMLKDRTGNMEKMDITSMIRQDEKMLLNYFKKEIEQYHFNVKFNIPEGPLYVNGNGELLSKTVMSLLGNSVYALIKKSNKGNAYTPEISLTLAQNAHQTTIVIYDNGIGIEESIIAKIFDPFFTTKTTSEASGVGLYLSKEIVQNHGGDITVQSKKDEFTEFTITLPTL